MILSQGVFKARIGGVQTKLDWATIEPFCMAAERDFKGKIGLELFRYLEALSDIYAEEYQLRVLAEGALSWLSFIRALPFLKFKIGDLGIMKTSPNNTVAITKWEYIDTTDAAEREANDWMEDFFQMLEQVRPPVWTASAAYRRRQRHFIRSTDEMAEFVSLGGGRNSRFFDQLVPYIKRAEELYVLPILTESDFEALRDKWQDPETVWSKEEKKILELIKLVVAPMAYYEAFPFLPLQVDYKSFSSPRSKDGVVEEREPDPNDISTLKGQFYKDGQLYAVKLKNKLRQVASPDFFPGHYQAFLKAAPAEKPEDYTDSPHVIM